MKLQRVFFCILFYIVFSVGDVISQPANEDGKPESLTMVFPSYTFQFPGGDLGHRFGNNSAIGAGLLLRNKSNWLFGGDVNFIFGNHIKEDSLLNNLLTSDGYIIGIDGTYADVSLFERGFYSSFKTGKIIPLVGSNKNSGLMILAGGGYLQHKIRIEVKDNTAPQLQNDYKKGYDRMSDGFQVNGFLGYIYFGKSRLTNFYVGLEYIYSWTQNRRSMNFDVMRRDDQSRIDTFTGIKAGWIIPFRERASDDYYFY